MVQHRAQVKQLARPYKFTPGLLSSFILKETQNHFVLFHKDDSGDYNSLELIIYNRDTFAEERRIQVYAPDWSREELDNAIVNFAPNPNY